MITLDEAIEQERKQAKMYRCEYECDCDYYGKGFVDDYADEFVCIKKMHEHEQRAKWFEELKMYKEVGTVEGYKSAIECYNEEYTMRKSNKQYNKAIDDVMNKAKEIQEEQIKNLEQHPRRGKQWAIYMNTHLGHIQIACKRIIEEQLKEHDVK